MVTEQSLSVEDKVLLAQVASERAVIVAKYDKVGVVCYIYCISVCHLMQLAVFSISVILCMK